MSGETYRIEKNDKNHNITQLTRNCGDHIEITNNNQNNSVHLENMEEGQNDENFSSTPLILENMKFEVIDVKIIFIKSQH